MSEAEVTAEHSQLLSEQNKNELYKEIIEEIEEEPWKDKVNQHKAAVGSLIRNGIELINILEEASYQKHPEIHADTDVIYIDSGPGPYSYKMLEEGKSDLDDVNYHKWKWSRKMDRSHIRTAYAIAAHVTSKRLQKATGVSKSINELTEEDFEKYSPSLMYTSVDWQASHIRNAMTLSRVLGNFRIPESKIVMYETFKSEDGETKPIHHTQDQIEGLRFPKNPDGTSPRRVVMVSHPAHLLRILHILSRYHHVIPKETALQLFPITTPKEGVREYAKAEILGTLATIFKERATFEPFNRYKI